MEYDIISTGSIGNAVVINKCILIDCGVSFEKLKGIYKSLQLVLLTHSHCDHFKASTIRKLAQERPTLKFICGAWLVNKLIECNVDKKNIFITNPTNKIKLSNGYEIESVNLYHNIDNCGYRIKKGNKKMFYATDTYTLNGIKAKNYDLYMVEANYIEEEINERIKAKELLNQYVYEYDAKENHLSKEKCDEWLLQNINENSEIVYLHKHINLED